VLSFVRRPDEPPEAVLRRFAETVLPLVQPNSSS
jgi:hypothetical protein